MKNYVFVLIWMSEKSKVFDIILYRLPIYLIYRCIYIYVVLRFEVQRDAFIRWMVPSSGNELCK